VVKLNHTIKVENNKNNKKMKEKFGQKLKELRVKKGLTLRNACRLLRYDPSNWSKIERGRMSPPPDEKTLIKWAKALGLLKEKDISDFIYSANLAQGIIPKDVLSRENAVNFLPAFFRTMSNKKPTKKDIDRLVDLIRKI
jgi:transcriptional regulator with XRE-family HTH domain